MCHVLRPRSTFFPRRGVICAVVRCKGRQRSRGRDSVRQPPYAASCREAASCMRAGAFERGAGVQQCFARRDASLRQVGGG